MLGNVLFSKSNRFKLSQIFFYVSLFVLVFGFSLNAFAKSDKLKAEMPSPVTTVTSDTVTVIGSRLPDFKVPFADVPANVSYIPANLTQKNKDQIYLTHPRDFQSSIRDIEGAVFYDEVGNGVDTTFSLRGFSEGSAVVVLVDGVRVNEVDGDVVNYPLLNMNDIESIQVDRGSASPIFGSNAFAGVVHITTGRPSPKPLSLFGGFEYSSFKGIRFYQGLSGTLQDKITPLGGKFSYYFNGGRNANEGFRDNGEWRITSFDLKTAYELPEEGGRVHVEVKHIDDATSNPGALTFDQYQENPEQTTKPLDGRNMRNTIISMGADKSFWDDHILASILASMRYNRLQFFTTSATFTDFADGFNPDTDLVETDSRSTDLIWQLAYQDDWKDLHHQTLLGMEMRDGSNRALERDAFQGLLVTRTANETERGSEIRSGGLYWRETLKVWEKVIAHFGMRHDFNWLKSNDVITPASNLSRRWKATTLSTGLTVKPLESLDVFANYSQGFRVPTISEIAPFSGTISTNLNPERSDSYEVGTRVRYQDLARLKTSFFVIDMKDEIVFDSTSIGPTAPFGQNINIGKSRRTGIETRLDISPVKEVDLYGSYTWTKAFVRETDGGGALVDGRALGQIPENRITFGTNIRPLVRFGEYVEGLRLGIDGVFTGRQHPFSYESTSQATLNATGGAGHVIKSYTIWNFIASYTLKGQEIYFKVNNVFDQKYYTRAVSATSFGTAIYPAGTYSFVNPGAPREYLFGTRWEI